MNDAAIIIECRYSVITILDNTNEFLAAVTTDSNEGMILGQLFEEFAIHNNGVFILPIYSDK